ncbi:hypothetical protein [Streptomyces aureus]|uniref:Uncharacterized protein n=1 Tax=Streptomyces aureus TaxID=193461 RepID=A0ABV4SQ89_9ACTN
MGEDQAADGAYGEAQAEGREGGERRRERGDVREEDLVEDDRGRGAEEEEVVPLEDRADDAGGGGAAVRRCRVRALIAACGPAS